METVGPPSYGFIYVGLLERSRTTKHQTFLPTYLLVTSTSTANSCVPLTSLSHPQACFFSSIYILC